MHIEKEISESYFRNASHKTVVNILFTSNWIVEQVKEFLEVDGITPQQYNILRILHNHKAPMSTLRIREKMLDKMSDTSRIVERLLKKELVNKQISTHDKRLVDVTLSDKGSVLMERLEKKSNVLDEIVCHLSETECDSLNTLLDKIREKD